MQNQLSEILQISASGEMKWSSSKTVCRLLQRYFNYNNYILGIKYVIGHNVEHRQQLRQYRVLTAKEIISLFEPTHESRSSQSNCQVNYIHYNFNHVNVWTDYA